MKKILIIAIAGFIATFSSAQTEKADTLFAKWDYFKAAQCYAKEAEKKPTQDVYYKLGQCYQKMDRFKEALSAYDKVNAAGAYSNATFYLNYGLILKTGERYADAKVAFTTYNNMMPSDPRGKFYKSSCDTVIADHTTDLYIKITPVLSLNSNASDFCPVIYKDGVVFISSRKTGSHDSRTYAWNGEDYLDIFYAKKRINDTGFEKPEPMESSLINTKYHNGPVCFSKNFDTIYFDRVSKELRGREKKTLNIETIKIYSAVNKNGQWVDLKPFQYNNDTFSVATPYLSKDGSRLYFSSNMPGGYGGNDLYYCVKQGSGWGKPVNMGPNINTFGNEKFPTMDDSGSFYFSSDGYKGYGGMDICVSKNTNGTFGPASVMKAPINSAGNDYGITFTKPGKAGYLSSNRTGGTGDEDIYYFDLNKDNLPCPLVVSDYVIGYKCTPQPKPIAALDSVKPLTLVDNSTIQPVKKKSIATVDKTVMLIHFDLDKSNIRTDDAEILNGIVAKMRMNTALNLVVDGYCDSRGTVPYNQVLSDLRSAATVNYLVSKGIDKKRMLPKGYGKTHIMNKCTDGVQCTDYEFEQDRRVEMKFIPLKKDIVVSDK